MELSLHEILLWFFLSTVKFVITPSTMIAAGYSWLEVVIIVAASAAVGFTGFYFFGELIFKQLDRLRKKPKRIFTRGNRRLVHIKKKYGLRGLGLISGVISVPIAGLVCAKFFHNPKQAIPSMILALTIWTIALTSASWAIRNVFHGSL